MLNKAHVTEIIKACIIAFIKQQIPSLFNEEITKKDGENVFFKGLTKIFVNNKKLLMADLSNGPHEKVMICYIIMLCF